MKVFSELVVIGLTAALLLLTTTGCLSDDQREELRNAAHAAILEYVESEGQEKALEYIDQLVADGKLGAANAEKIKAAIPEGIDRLREVMGEIEQEENENE